MKNLYLLLILIPIPLLTRSQIHDFSNYPEYTGTNLGLTYSREESVFTIWSPVAEKAEVIFYASGTGGTPVAVHSMKPGVSGTWQVTVKEKAEGLFYVFRVMIDGKWLAEVPDPYAKIVGVNGRRAMVGDLNLTDPEGWENDVSPSWMLNEEENLLSPLQKKTAAVIYELHVRDAGIHESSGIRMKGKYSGLTESGTINPDQLSTGLDHLKDLGVTHIHLLPSFDFFSVDESSPDSLQYNWGYDPLNYNTPEGSYSTNPYDGYTRIREFKELIKTFHANGLRVIMDVVYNHTMFIADSWFNQLVPGYYYRQKPDGTFSDATACGNETASERPMMRKFMVESMEYWVKEYHIDGFRIDLMGVHDIETLNRVSESLHELKPDILLYGEGWTAGPSPLPDMLRGIKKNVSQLDRIAVFSDDIRDGIKGSVFRHEEKGFASGRAAMEETIKFGVTASCAHPQVDYLKVNYSDAPYSKEPFQTISYCECHDNHVLWDKLAISAKSATEEERRNMHLLSLSIVLTSQGIPFLHAGSEFLRSKFGVENSYNSGDSINAINWTLKTKNIDVYNYTKELIRLRRKHPSFRMTSGNDIAKHIRFFEKLPEGLVVYALDGKGVGDSWKRIIVAFNGTGQTTKFSLPDGKWEMVCKNNQFTSRPSSVRSLQLAPYSCSIVYQQQ